ncbi:10229_t:CDS:2, partial [Scutellospora calospora]
YLQIYDDLLSCNNIEPSSLYSGKKFATWELCESFLNEWVKFQGFRIIKDHVQRDNGKYPTQLIYSKDLYAAIQKFRPNSKTLSNDAAKNAFEQYFNKLIQDFPNAKSYLEFFYKLKDH